MRSTFIGLILLSCVGCMTQEGLMLGKQPYVNSYLVKYGSLSKEIDDEQKVTGLVAIGTLSAFRQYQASDFDREYRHYEKSYKRWKVEGQPSMTIERFRTEMAGWTRIKVFGIPLVGATYLRSLVPEYMADELKFEPGITTFLFQTSEDLVAAKSNIDGAFVLNKLLCRRDRNYKKCSSHFKKGIFDSKTGEQLKGKLEVKKNGVHIDIETFEVIR